MRSRSPWQFPSPFWRHFFKFYAQYFIHDLPGLVPSWIKSKCRNKKVEGSLKARGSGLLSQSERWWSFRLRDRLVFRVRTPVNRDLTKLWRRQHRQRSKAIGLVIKTTTLHVHHAFLYISMTSLHDYYVKWPNLKAFWGRERQGDKLYHLCVNSVAAPLFSSNVKSLLLNTWRLGIIAKWFERMQSLFFSEVFMDVAVVRS